MRRGHFRIGGIRFAIPPYRPSIQFRRSLIHVALILRSRAERAASRRMAASKAHRGPALMVRPWFETRGYRRAPHHEGLCVLDFLRVAFDWGVLS